MGRRASRQASCGKAAVAWRSIGERGGVDAPPLDGDFHLRAEARLRAGLRRLVTAPDGGEVSAALDDEPAALPTVVSMFEPGYVIERDNGTLRVSE